MANIIDSLYVALGLDASGMKKGAEEAAKAQEKLQEDAEKTQKAITSADKKRDSESSAALKKRVSEEDAARKKSLADDKKAQDERNQSAKKAAEGLAKVRNEVLGLMTAYFGLNAMKNAGEKLITSGFEGSLKSGALGIGIRDLTAWKGAAAEFGASGEEIEGTFAKINALQTGLQTGDAGTLSTFNEYARTLTAKSGGKVTANTSVLMNRDTTDQQFLMELAKETSRLSEKDAVQALAKLGIAENTALALHSGNVALAASLEAYKKLHPDIEKSTEESRKLATEWVKLKHTMLGIGETIMAHLAPILESVVSWALNNIPAAIVLMGGLSAIVLSFSAISLAGFIGSLSAAAAGVGLLAGGVSRLLLLLGNTGLVAAAGLAAGYALGSFINTGINALVKKTTGNSSLGEWAYDALHPSSSPKYSKFQKDRAAQDIATLQRMGWTKEQATGIAANILRESGGNAGAIGDNGKAYGLGQWHPDRQANFAKWAGHSIRQSTRAEQLAFISYELTQGSEIAAGRKLLAAKSAAVAGAIVSRFYERPAASSEGALRAGIANDLFGPGPAIDKGLNTGAASMMANHGVGNQNNASHIETNINGPININAPNAKTNGDVASAIGEKLQTFTFASQANYGLL